MITLNFSFAEVAKRFPDEPAESARIETRSDGLFGFALGNQFSSCYCMAEVADLRALHAWLGEALAEIDPQPETKGT